MVHGDWIYFGGLGSKCLYPLSHLAGPVNWLIFFKSVNGKPSFKNELRTAENFPSQALRSVSSNFLNSYFRISLTNHYMSEEANISVVCVSNVT